MNLYALLNRGIVNSGVHERNLDEQTRKIESFVAHRKNAFNDARALWISSLLADETRSWMHVSEKDRGSLVGLISVLTLAGVAKSHDDGGSFDSVEVRVIRGAISAATQCADSADCVISADDARAFSAASNHARQIIATCSDEAIAQSAMHMHNFVNSKEVH